MNQDIYQFIQATLRSQCLIKAEITPDSSFVKDLALDSVGAMTLMSHLEMQYKINFDVTTKPPQRVKELVELVEKLKSQ